MGKRLIPFMSSTAPSVTNVLWLDTSKNPVLPKIYDGSWRPISVADVSVINQEIQGLTEQVNTTGNKVEALKLGDLPNQVTQKLGGNIFFCTEKGMPRNYSNFDSDSRAGRGPMPFGYLYTFDVNANVPGEEGNVTADYINGLIASDLIVIYGKALAGRANQVYTRTEILNAGDIVFWNDNNSYDGSSSNGIYFVIEAGGGASNPYAALKAMVI